MSVCIKKKYRFGTVHLQGDRSAGNEWQDGSEAFKASNASTAPYVLYIQRMPHSRCTQWYMVIHSQQIRSLASNVWHKPWLSCDIFVKEFTSAVHHFRSPGISPLFFTWLTASRRARPEVLTAHLAGWLRLAAQSLAAEDVKVAVMAAKANSAKRCSQSRKSIPEWYHASFQCLLRHTATFKNLSEFIWIYPKRWFWFHLRYALSKA